MTSTRMLIPSLLAIALFACVTAAAGEPPTRAEIEKDREAIIAAALELTPQEGESFWPVYRAYRVPYEWVPQAEKPEEKAVERLDNNKFRVPGSPRRKAGKTTGLKNRGKVVSAEQYCVVPKDVSDNS